MKALESLKLHTQLPDEPFLAAKKINLAKLSPKAQERVATKTKQMLAEMPLNELRKKRALSKK